MSDLKELFEKGRWYHCFHHEGLKSNGTYDIEQYIKYYNEDRIQEKLGYRSPIDYRKLNTSS